MNNKNLTSEFAKVLRMTVVKNPQFSGVQSVEVNGEEVWADKLTAEDIQEIEKELGNRYKVQSRLANGTDTMELYLTIPKKKTTEEFIEQARKVHGDKYDYSKVNYVNANTKVTIISPTHGEFQQTPSSHLSGHGCPLD